MAAAAREEKGGGGGINHIAVFEFDVGDDNNDDVEVRSLPAPVWGLAAETGGALYC